MLFKFYFILACMLLMPTKVVGQKHPNESAIHTKAELIEDLSYLEKSLIKGHPGLYWHSSKSDFLEIFKHIQDTIYSGMSELDFLNQVAQLNSIIKCAHSDIRPSEAFSKAWKDTANLIPINIAKVNSEYIIYQNLSTSKVLSLGTKLISINGISIHNIVEHLLPFIPADGDNQTRKYTALKRGFYRYFSYYHTLSSKTYKIIYEDANGQAEVTVKGIKKAEFDYKRRRLENAQMSYPPISFQILDSNPVALLKIRTFRNDLMEKNNIIFEDFIDSCFNALHTLKTENLILDLRDNNGGYSEYAAVLYTYLSDTAFRYCKNQIVTSDKLIKGIDYDIPETFQDYPNGIIFENGQYKWPKHSVLGWRKPAENNFSGNVYFLINGGCSSTTSEMAALAHSNGIGIFVGEEVGGCYAGNSGGVLGWFELPNTKIKIRIGMVKYEIAEDNLHNKHGVTPDFKVDYTREDVISGKDLDIELALKKIKEGYRKP